MSYAPDRFNELVKEFAAKEKGIMTWKRGEYTEGADRLQNFREVARFVGPGAKPADIALVYFLKHVQSIKQAVTLRRCAWAWETEGGEGLKQRIADARNYLLLLAACLDEEAGE